MSTSPSYYRIPTNLLLPYIHEPLSLPSTYEPLVSFCVHELLLLLNFLKPRVLPYIQHTSTPRNVVHHTTAHCSTLQHTAAHTNHEVAHTHTHTHDGTHTHTHTCRGHDETLGASGTGICVGDE